MSLVYLPTTVAGSYPLVYDARGLYKALIEQSEVSCTNLNDWLVANGVLDQLWWSGGGTRRGAAEDAEVSLEEFKRACETSLDIVSTGQHRLTIDGNMCVPFLRCLDGVEINRHGAAHLITFGKRRLTFNSEEFDSTLRRDAVIAHQLVDSLNGHLRDGNKKKLKFAFTGPYTLLWGDGVVWQKERGRELLEDFSSMLLEMVRTLRNDGLLRNVHHIAIDEPVLSQGPEREDQFEGLNTLCKLCHDLRGMLEGLPIIIHICGNLEFKLFAELFERMEPRVGVHVELAGKRKANELAGFLEAISRFWHSDRRQYEFPLCIGIVDSSSLRIEEAGQVEAFVERALERLEMTDEDDLLLSPNCGLRGLPLEVAQRKLKTLCEAAAGSQRAASRRVPSVGPTSLDERKHPYLYEQLAQRARAERSRGLQEFIAECEKRLTTIQSTHPRFPFTYYTVHSPVHISEVLRFADKFARLLTFGERECELLVAAAYGHDVGLFIEPDEWRTQREGGVVELDESGIRELHTRVRDEHELRAVAAIRDERRLGSMLRQFGEDFVRDLCEIIVAHRFNKELPVGGAGRRGAARLVAAVLKFCDECDITFRRLPSLAILGQVLNASINDLSEIQVDSRPHLMKLDLVGDVLLRFPQKSLVIKLRKRPESQEARRWCREICAKVWDQWIRVEEVFRDVGLEFRDKPAVVYDGRELQLDEDTAGN